MIIDACVEGKSLGACSIVYCLVDGIIAAADQLLYHKYAEIKCFDRQEHTRWHYDSKMRSQTI
jgi:hypothetical protein